MVFSLHDSRFSRADKRELPDKLQKILHDLRVTADDLHRIPTKSRLLVDYWLRLTGFDGSLPPCADPLLLNLLTNHC